MQNGRGGAVREFENLMPRYAVELDPADVLLMCGFTCRVQSRRERSCVCEEDPPAASRPRRRAETAPLPPAASD